MNKTYSMSIRVSEEELDKGQVPRLIPVCQSKCR